MKPEIKKLWVAALRSGKYKKGTGELHPTSKTYCCLGVLCDLHRKATGEGKWVKDRGLVDECHYAYEMGAYTSDCNTLPWGVREWAGLTDPELYNPALAGEEGFSCTECNDTHDFTFPQIAERIEKAL